MFKTLRCNEMSTDNTTILMKASKEIFTVTVLIICCTLRGGSPLTPLEAAVLPC